MPEVLDMKSLMNLQFIMQREQVYNFLVKKPSLPERQTAVEELQCNF